MTDREKFTAWLAQCPVTVREIKNFAYGYIEVHVSLYDESLEKENGEEEDWRFPWERKYEED